MAGFARSKGEGTSSSVVAHSSQRLFQRPSFFKVLGRIDEESSFRASISNITSRDNSPQSSSTSPNDKAALNRASNDHRSYQSQHVSVTAVKDSKLEAMTISPLGYREADSSSPSAEVNKQSSPNEAEPQHTLGSQKVSGETDHKEALEKLPPSPQTPNNSTDHRLNRQRSENEAMTKECQVLEAQILAMRNEANLLQMKSTVRLQNYQRAIERAILEQTTLQAACREMEDELWKLRLQSKHERTAEDSMQTQCQREPLTPQQTSNQDT